MHASTAWTSRAALAAPGVIAVLTAADVPVNEYGLIMPDQPVLCGPGSTPQAEVVRWEADHVALVVAESEAQAEAAATAWSVRLRATLPVVTDPVDALQPDAPILHPHPFRFPYGERDLHSNVLLEYRRSTATSTPALPRPTSWWRAPTSTQAQEHAYLQPEAGLAYVRPDGRIEVICGGQWMHEEREQIAHALGSARRTDRRALSGHRRRLWRARRYLGADCAGAGGLEDGPPRQDRLEPRREHRRPSQAPSRSPSVAKWGATRDGKIVAAQVDMTSDGGAYAYTSTKVLGNALLAAARPLRNPQRGCHGTHRLHQQHAQRRLPRLWRPAGTLCRRDAGQQAGRRRWAWTRSNCACATCWRDGSMLPTRSPLPAGCTAVECRSGRARSRLAGRGSDWTRPAADASMPATGAVRSDLARRHTAPHGARRWDRCLLQERGLQPGLPGTLRGLGGIARQPGDRACRRRLRRRRGGPGRAHPLPPDRGRGAGRSTRSRSRCRPTIPTSTGSSGSASASRMSFMAGNAIKGAAERALVEWQNEERPARAEFVFHPRPTTGYNRQTGESDPNITYGYCAQVADVEVDLETGHVTVYAADQRQRCGPRHQPAADRGADRGRGRPVRRLDVAWRSTSSATAAPSRNT